MSYTVEGLMALLKPLEVAAGAMIVNAGGPSFYDAQKHRNDARKAIEEYATRLSGVSDSRDAERYRWLRNQTGAGLKDLGALSPSFRLPAIQPVRGANIMKGSVAQHLDAAIDAAMSPSKEQEGRLTEQPGSVHQTASAGQGVNRGGVNG